MRSQRQTQRAYPGSPLLQRSTPVSLRVRLERTLAPHCVACGFAAVAAHPDGRTLLIERPDLEAALADLDGLARLPKGSLGRAYARFLTAEWAGCTDPGECAPRRQCDSAHCWFHRRLRALHPLYHVLTGYGTDDAGELATLAFACGQTRSRAAPLLLAVASLGTSRSGSSARRRFAWQALRRGRRARLLSVVRFEDLLPHSFEVVRQSLGIESSQAAHPQGLPTAARGR